MSKTITYKAKVLGFDKRRGEGFVKIEGQPGIFDIYACNLPGKRTWYAETACMFYEVGQVIDVQAVEGGLMCLTPGTFDQAKWDGLDHDRLAFRCDANGKATSGLFAKERSTK